MRLFIFSENIYIFLDIPLNARKYKVLMVSSQIVCQDFYALIKASNRFENHQEDELSFTFISKKYIKWLCK
jgi:hypothetical protein